MEKRIYLLASLPHSVFHWQKSSLWALRLGYTVQPCNGAKDSVDPITAEALGALSMAHSMGAMAKAKPLPGERWKLGYVAVRIYWAISRDALARKQGKCLGFKKSSAPCRYEICMNWISTLCEDTGRPPMHCHVFPSSTQTKLLPSIPSPHMSFFHKAFLLCFSLAFSSFLSFHTGQSRTWSQIQTLWDSSFGAKHC